MQRCWQKGQRAGRAQHGNGREKERGERESARIRERREKREERREREEREKRGREGDGRVFGRIVHARQRK